MSESRVRELLIEQEMKSSYLSYAMSVIVSRALPDVRDGLKPSQRRILVAMNDLNLSPKSPFRKCAKVVGDTSGNYHPHGDQAIYPTLVRMAQTFNMRYPLVEGQGNFGSIDGDPPAAMRYTECRLTEAASLLLEDLKYNTVEFVPNYDDTRQEPTVLPGPFPNLLANGSSGIAVGMATSLPPHNLVEVANALIALIDNPNITTEELMHHILGPDFPTGGIICGLSGIRTAYETGRATITVKARVHKEEENGRVQLVVTEIPYQVTKSKIIEKIVEQVKNGKIQGIADLRDESDREGMRLVILLKKGENPEVVLNQLFKHTQLQSTFSIIMIALKNGKPKLFNLKELLQAYLDHRFHVITRKTQFLLRQAKKKGEELEGLLVAQEYIDDVIELIRKSQNPEEARKNLISFFQSEERLRSFFSHKFTPLQKKAKEALEKGRSLLSASQVDVILKMRLQNLTGLEREKLESSYQTLQEEIRKYESILSDKNKIYQIIREEAEELKKKFPDPRRTEIQPAEAEEFSEEELITPHECAVTLSTHDYIKRVPLDTYKQQRRGGVGILAAQTREEDTLKQVLVVHSHDYLLFFTNSGRLFARRGFEIPEMARRSPGRAIANFLEIEPSEKVTSLFSVKNFEAPGFLFMVTDQGTVKKTPLSQFAYVAKSKGRGIQAIQLDEGETLVETLLTSGEDDILIATCKGKAILFEEAEVRPMGRSARGVRGIRLGEGDRVCGMVKADEKGMVLVITEKGFGKRTPFKEFRKTHRGGQGVKLMNVSPKTGEVISLHLVRSEKDEVVLITQQGMIIRLAVAHIRICGRPAQGVKLIKLREQDRLVSSSVISENPD